MTCEETDLENLEFSRNKRPEDGLLSVFFHFSSIVRAFSPFFSIFSQLWGHFYRFFLFFLNYGDTLAVFFYFFSIVGSLLPFSICFFSYDDAGKLWRDDGLQAGGHCTQLPPLRDLPTRILLSRTDVDFTKKEQAAGLVPFLIDDATGLGSYRL